MKLHIFDLMISLLMFATLIVVYIVGKESKDWQRINLKNFDTQERLNESNYNHLKNIAQVIIWYLGFIRIPCVLQTIHVYFKYNSKSLNLLVIFAIYEGIALGILIWARVKWSQIDNCRSSMLFSVLFGIMYISFFIFGRAAITLSIVLIIVVYRLVKLI